MISDIHILYGSVSLRQGSSRLWVSYHFNKVEAKALIIDGKLTGKIVSPVVMSGYVIDLLNSISAVSRDFEIIGSGSCGKGYKEWVRVSDGGPYLKAKVKIG